MDHRLEHLGGGDHALAEQTAFGDQMLLDGRELLKGDLNAHIAAADHDAVAGLADLLDVVNARLIFDLGDQVDIIDPVLG